MNKRTRLISVTALGLLSTAIAAATLLVKRKLAVSEESPRQSHDSVSVPPETKVASFFQFDSSLSATAPSETRSFEDRDRLTEALNRVTTRLYDVKSLSRNELMNLLTGDLTYDEIMAELNRDGRFVEVGSGRGLRVIFLGKLAPAARLSLAEFADYISQQTGLLSGPAISIYISKHFGWAPSIRSLGG